MLNFPSLIITLGSPPNPCKRSFFESQRCVLTTSFSSSQAMAFYGGLAHVRVHLSCKWGLALSPQCYKHYRSKAIRLNIMNSLFSDCLNLSVFQYSSFATVYSSYHVGTGGLNLRAGCLFSLSHTVRESSRPHTYFLQFTNTRVICYFYVFIFHW